MDASKQIVALAREKAIGHVMNLGGMTRDYASELLMSLKSPRYANILEADTMGEIHEIIRES